MKEYIMCIFFSYFFLLSPVCLGMESSDSTNDSSSSSSSSLSSESTFICSSDEEESDDSLTKILTQKLDEYNEQSIFNPSKNMQHAIEAATTTFFLHLHQLLKHDVFDQNNKGKKSIEALLNNAINTFFENGKSIFAPADEDGTYNGNITNCITHLENKGEELVTHIKKDLKAVIATIPKELQTVFGSPHMPIHHLSSFSI